MKQEMKAWAYRRRCRQGPEVFTLPDFMLMVLYLHEIANGIFVVSVVHKTQYSAPGEARDRRQYEKSNDARRGW